MRRFTTADGLTLEGELAPAPGAPSAGVVLCHPHPQYGGTMRSIVTSALFEALPNKGVTCLRFNFRGVGSSEGAWGGGVEERHDVVAAIDALTSELAGSVAVAVIGWSFGGDMALSVDDSRVDGWMAVAPPLRFAEPAKVASDTRPKHVVLAEHDEIRPPAEIEAAVASWTATTVEVVGGASHFFVGRTDRVVAAANVFCAQLLKR